MAQWTCAGCGQGFDEVIDPPWVDDFDTETGSGETLCDDCVLKEEDAAEEEASP